jgi:hypothetical protein
MKRYDSSSSGRWSHHGQKICLGWRKCVSLALKIDYFDPMRMVPVEVDP